MYLHKKVWKITKKWLKTKLKIKNVNSNKGFEKGCIRQNWQRYNTFADGRRTHYMHQIACIYIVVPQQKWNNAYVETAYKLEGGNVSNYCFQVKELTRVRIFKFF